MFDAFYSDPHFGYHKAAQRRGFASVADHDEALVSRYAAGGWGCVAWLGDVTRHSKAGTRALLDRLPGRKVLVPGNHDWGKSEQWFYDAGFDLVLSRQVVYQLAGRRVKLSHLPYAGVLHAKGEDDRYAEERPVRVKGEMLLHGHTHRASRGDPGSGLIHVGVDAWDLAPVGVGVICAAMEAT